METTKKEKEKKSTSLNQIDSLDVGLAKYC